MKRDLNVAKDVQQGLLPDSRPNLKSYDFFDYYQPADQVGTDYFDYIPLPDGRLAVVVADVAGVGIATAILLAYVRAETPRAFGENAIPAKAASHLNKRLCQLQPQAFVTMIVVVLDAVNHQLTIVNAGHMPPLIRRKDGTVEEPGENVAGLVMGITEDISYEQVETTIGIGENVTIYTDGIPESIDKNGAFYTIDRMRKLACEHNGRPEQFGRLIIDDAQQFLSGADQSDDMCLVCFGRTCPDRAE